MRTESESGGRKQSRSISKKLSKKYRQSTITARRALVGLEGTGSVLQLCVCLSQKIITQLKNRMLSLCADSTQSTMYPGTRHPSVSHDHLCLISTHVKSSSNIRALTGMYRTNMLSKAHTWHTHDDTNKAHICCKLAGCRWLAPPAHILACSQYLESIRSVSDAFRA